MSLLSFLKKATVEEIVEEKKRSGGGVAKQWNPNPTVLAVRVWKDGRVFPSQAAVDKFALEYQQGTYETKVAEAVTAEDGTTGVPKATTVFVHNSNPGNGFDIIDSRVWNGYKAEGDMIFLGVVPKTATKVDLFAQTRYDKDGKPLGSVMDQGTATFGKEVLLPAIKDLYGIELSDEKEFVDMMIVSDIDGFNISEHFSKPIIYAPKRVVRGKDAGKPDYIRRENMTIYGFVPAEVLNGGSEAQPEAESTVELTEEVQA